MKAFLLLLIVALVLAFTNPGLDSFVDWAVDTVTAANEGVPILEVLSASVARPLLRNTTDRTSYGLLSIFTVKGISQEKRYLGIAGQFFALDGDELDLEALEE